MFGYQLMVLEQIFIALVTVILMLGFNMNEHTNV